MDIDHRDSTFSSPTVADQRRNIQTLQAEVAELERGSPSDPDLERKREELRLAYNLLGRTGFVE
jgi:hypothetical protein